MIQDHQSDDFVGIISGLIGYTLYKLKATVVILDIQAMPSFSELAHSLINTVVCAGAGWIVTRTLSYLFEKITKRKDAEKL